MYPTAKASIRVTEPAEEGFHPVLSRVEMAAVIDALLQAEITLPLVDTRNLSLSRIEWVRSLQLSLAHRLEDLLAEDIHVRLASL
ncbi:hypothetical protein [Aestuariivirga litoralis]|uniref:hypothetical protein n=1 Tax=Aestuariivirga litoralis TaxID=2650924 RepID=UPI0011B35D84|nr:hypothetical protein [Aestuariivirga litoralis]